jgi:uracil-DNA glycosylase family 4
MLSAAGIRRSENFFTNICHIQPRGKKKNDFEWFLTPEGQPYLLHGIMQLNKDLNEIRPNVVVALGAQPLRVLTKKIGIDKYRGSILASTLSPGLKVIATYHPAFIIRTWDYKAVAEMDFRRIRADAEFPDLALPQRDLHLNLPRHEREPIINEMLQSSWLAIDIECYERADGTWQLACVGFSDRASRALVIPNWDAGCFADIKLLCESEGPDKVFQNGQFDVSVLAKEGNQCQRIWRSIA